MYKDSVLLPLNQIEEIIKDSEKKETNYKNMDDTEFENYVIDIIKQKKKISSTVTASKIYLKLYKKAQKQPEEIRDGILKQLKYITKNTRN